VVVLLAVAAYGCGGSSGGGGPTPAPSPGAGSLRPVATIRLSGSTASGLAEAGGWLWVTHFEASTISQVDPRTNTEVSRVEVGLHAGSVTAVGPRLWIAHYTGRPEDSRLTGLDPLPAAVVRRVQPPHLCCEVAGAGGLLWAVDPRGALITIDPERGALVGTTPADFDPRVHIALVGDERALWLSSDTTPLHRIDPATGRVVTSLDVGGGIPMAVAQGLVWGAGPHHVWAVDPESNQVRLRLPLENTIETLSLAVTDDALWVGARRPGHVGVILRLDLASGRLTGEAPAGLPARVLYAFGDVWVADWNANTLLRFD
jgi:streptogramin lyase